MPSGEYSMTLDALDIVPFPMRDLAPSGKPHLSERAAISTAKMRAPKVSIISVKENLIFMRNTSILFQKFDTFYCQHFSFI